MIFARLFFCLLANYTGTYVFPSRYKDIRYLARRLPTVFYSISQSNSDLYCCALVDYHSAEFIHRGLSLRRKSRPQKI